MKKLILSIAAAITAIVWLSAAPVTPSKAQSIAEAFFANTRLRSSAPIQLSYTHSPSSEALRTTSSGASAYYYVFNRGANEGFVIVAGDDRLNEILAYGEQGHFSFEELPVQIAWWMGQYDKQIALLLDTNPLIKPVAEVRAARAIVQPLLEKEGITWDQGSPFNDLCPVFAEGKRAYSGCVATALAQILRYHKWPEQAEGSISYNDRGAVREMTFGKEPYKWDLMLPDYKNKASSEQKRAVAQLLVELGYSVKMIYGVDSQGSSGAYSQNIASALRNNFKYKHAVHLVRRSAVNREKWEQLIHDELAAQRPVYYSGSTEGQGGHAFVCDGYNADGTFHFNWGWNGTANGYYRLDALRPQELGAGAGLGDYSSVQEIVIGIEPARNGATGERIYDIPEFIIRAGLSNDKATLSYNGLAYNSVTDLFNATTRVAIYKGEPTGIPLKIVNENKTVNLLLHTRDIVSGELPAAELEEGKYTLRYEWKPIQSSEYRPFNTAIDEPNYLIFEVKDGKFASLNYDSPINNLGVVEGSAVIDVKAYGSAKISVEVENSGKREYYGLMKVMACGKTRSSLGLDPTVSKVVTLPAGKKTRVTFEMEYFNLPKGEDATIYVYLPQLDPQKGTSLNGITGNRMTLEVAVAKVNVLAPTSYDRTTLVASIDLPETETARYNSAPPSFSGVTFDISNLGPRYQGSDVRYIGALFTYRAGMQIYRFVSINKMTSTIDPGQKVSYSPIFRKENLEAASQSQFCQIQIVCLIERGGYIYLDSTTPVLGASVRKASVYSDTSTDSNIQELEKASCFPNPADFTTTVRYDRAALTIDLFDAAGNLLQRFAPKASGKLSIDTSMLPVGTYFVGIRKAGGEVETLTLMVKH